MCGAGAALVITQDLEMELESTATCGQQLLLLPCC